MRVSPEASIWQNHLRFRELIDDASNAFEGGSDLLAVEIAQKAAQFAWNNSTGVMASLRLEAVLASIGKRIADSVKAPSHALAASSERILHVLTQAYPIGGHTRLVQQWITKDRGRHHGIVLTQQGEIPLPPWLKNHADLQNLDDSRGTLIERAARMRELSRHYGIVVVHTHPYDAVPVMAFPPGLSGGPRLLVVNHASHTFWLGASIGHAYAELYEAGRRLSLSRRGIEASRSLPIRVPIAEPIRSIDRCLARKGWSIPDNATVIFSCASPYKFNAIGAFDFRELVRQKLGLFPDLYLLLAGPSASAYWDDLEKCAPGRVRLLGLIPEHLMHAAFQAADIYVDSHPVGSGTAILEAASHKLPVLSFSEEGWRHAGLSIGRDDGLLPDNSIFSDLDAFSSQLARLIDDPAARAVEGQRQAEHVFAECIGEAWRTRLSSIYEHVLTSRPPLAVRDVAEIEPIDVILQQIFAADSSERTKALASAPAPSPDCNAPTDRFGFRTPYASLRDLPFPFHLVQPWAPQDVSIFEQRLLELGGGPTIRITISASDLHTRLLDTLETLASQHYKRFEVTLVLKSKVDEDILPIPVHQLIRNDLLLGINEAVSSSGENWVLFLASGDRLFPHSLLSAAATIAASKPQIVYSDELAYSGTTRNTIHQFKPDFNLSMIRSAPYIGGMLMIERILFLDTGGFRPGKEGVEEFDLVLRALEYSRASDIRHIDQVLIWRNYSDRLGATLPEEARRTSAQKSIEDHLSRSRIQAVVSECATPGTFRVRYLLSEKPLVTVIVPTRDQPTLLARCIEELLARTSYSNYEILVVNNNSRNSEAINLLSELGKIAPDKIRVLDYPHPFNFSAINNIAARHARGEYLLLLNDDVAALHNDWLDVLLEHAQQPDVGIVACRLVFPSGKTQHAGIILGLNGVADFPWNNAGLDFPGYGHRLQLDQDVSAVTSACMLIRHAVFDEVGGMDEHELKVAYGDFDLCLKVRQAGYRIVWTPHATLMHEAGSTLKRALDDPQTAAVESARFVREQEAFYLRWRSQLAHDPAYNQNLTLSSRTFEIESRTELAPDPITWHALPRIAALPGDLLGSGYYRVIDPAQGAHGAGLTRSRVLHGYPEPVVFERLDIDVLYSQRQVDDAQIAAVERMKRLSRCRIVMDFDDLLTHVPDYSIHKKDVWQDMQQRLERLCQSVDRVTVSTSPLAERMRRYHDDVRIVPNGLDAKRWTGLQSARNRSRRPRIGWVGGSAHAGDLALIRDIVRQLGDKVEWVFMGLYLQDMKPYLTEIHVGVPFEQYPARMAALDLDLALAPLEINPFNECKSNLRVLEYGALGIPVIASDIEPYRGDFPITRVKNQPQNWLNAIREHLADPEAMKRQGDALREQVLGKWMLDHQMPTWLEAWTF